MIVIICDCCKEEIINKEELSFKIKNERYRIAILNIKNQNGIRWKEADFCKKCIDKYLQFIVVDTINNPELCLNCSKNNNPATRYCRIGILKSGKKRTCKFKT